MEKFTAPIGECSSSSDKAIQDLKEQNTLQSTPNDNLEDFWLCAICLEKILPEDTSQIKGCEHAYCIRCILQWATYIAEPWCPRCKHPFSTLHVYRSLDGSLHDYMLEESVCLLLRASWFKRPLLQDAYREQHEDEDDDCYSPSNGRPGNPRWGDAGSVKAGQKEADGRGSQHERGGSSSKGKQRKNNIKKAR